VQGTFAVSGIENSTEPEPGTDRLSLMSTATPTNAMLKPRRG